MTTTQAGFTADYANINGEHTAITLTGSTAALATGPAAGLVFTATNAPACSGDDTWTTLAFTGTLAEQDGGNTLLRSTTSDGRLFVVDADPLGDCNAYASVNAGDFAATTLELFDSVPAEEVPADVPAGVPAAASWLWTRICSCRS